MGTLYYSLLTGICGQCTNDNCTLKGKFYSNCCNFDSYDVQNPPHPQKRLLNTSPFTINNLRKYLSKYMDEIGVDFDDDTPFMISAINEGGYNSTTVSDLNDCDFDWDEETCRLEITNRRKQ